jgi:hypothetical protein
MMPWLQEVNLHPDKSVTLMQKPPQSEMPQRGSQYWDTQATRFSSLCFPMEEEVKLP